MAVADSADRVVDYWCPEMLTIRCTRELLERLKVQAAGEPTRPTNRLGDWYAKLVATRRGMLAVCASERSLLPALVTATTDSDAFVVAFREALRCVLRGIGAESQWVQREARETEQIALGTTASRRILGSLNDLAFLARATIEDRRHIDLVALALELADTPCSPLNYETPRVVSLALMRQGHLVILSLVANLTGQAARRS